MFLLFYSREEWSRFYPNQAFRLMATKESSQIFPGGLGQLC
ncbi:MAG: hypothetical protein OP8BY_2053 [Candidatus Saccharicenans subterraneus]|uniref:Uncharacterized protein n=1 Tax=Candidatus Saccharicenans subterraneus TaxID=2508984 RepID=A0A3E2BN34_9BACT|nr:MAG: hypothetical protein OP8BY_2053 [Candidatus Saccharicenans subterraneum]